MTKISPFTVGSLIALFERAVGFYATLIHVNAYNQPGVEAGKKAAVILIGLQSQILSVIWVNALESAVMHRQDGGHPLQIWLIAIDTAQKDGHQRGVPPPCSSAASAAFTLPSSPRRLRHIRLPSRLIRSPSIVIELGFNIISNVFFVIFLVV